MSPVWMASKLASFTEASAPSRAQKQKLKNKLHLVYSQGCCQFSQPDDKALVEAILACEIACFLWPPETPGMLPPGIGHEQKSAAKGHKFPGLKHDRYLWIASLKQKHIIIILYEFI